MSTGASMFARCGVSAITRILGILTLLALTMLGKLGGWPTPIRRYWGPAPPRNGVQTSSFTVGPSHQAICPVTSDQLRTRALVYSASWSRVRRKRDRQDRGQEPKESGLS